MSNAKSRREIQAHLRTVIIAELDRMQLPDDGRHLARVVRALVGEAIAMLSAAGIPTPAIAQLIVETTKRRLMSPSAKVGAFGQHLPLGKA